MCKSAYLRRFLLLLMVLSCMGFSAQAGASLIDRGGGMIYDDVLDITWLQDANYSQTSGYDADGKMTWAQAVTWADQLVYGGYDDWRLLQTLPINGISYDYTWQYDGSSDYGVNMSAPGTVYAGSIGSEMAFMYYNNLGNISYYDTSGNPNQPGWGLQNTGPFVNIQDWVYWSATEYAPSTSDAWLFHFGDGRQGNWGKNNEVYAWAVRSGDVAPVPLPGAIWLFGTGLAGIGAYRRKSRRLR